MAGGDFWYNSLVRGHGLISYGLYAWPPLPPLWDPLPERLRFCFTKVVDLWGVTLDLGGV